MSDAKDESHPPGQPGAGKADAPALRPIDDTVQVEIGVRLKAYYDTITREPVPDRFVELLGELDNVDAPRPRSAEGQQGQTPRDED